MLCPIFSVLGSSFTKLYRLTLTSPSSYLSISNSWDYGPIFYLYLHNFNGQHSVFCQLYTEQHNPFSVFSCPNTENDSRARAGSNPCSISANSYNLSPTLLILNGHFGLGLSSLFFTSSCLYEHDISWGPLLSGPCQCVIIYLSLVRGQPSPFIYKLPESNYVEFFHHALINNSGNTYKKWRNIWTAEYEEAGGVAQWLSTCLGWPRFWVQSPAPWK